MKSRFIIIVLVLLTALLSSCSSNESDPVRTKYRLTVPGTVFKGFQGDIVNETIRAGVTDQDGNPVSGFELIISDVNGGGSVQTAKGYTDQDGNFEIIWSLGQEYYQKLTVSSVRYPEIYRNISAQALYNYKIPPERNDGLETETILNHSSIKTNSIFEGIDNIRKGQFKEMHSVLIVKDDKLIFEEYFSGHNSNGELIHFDINTPHEQQSASKSFRSMLIGLAIDHGFIESTDEKLHTFFPELTYLKENGKQDIKLEHILTMSSGLSWNEWIAIPNDLSEMYSKPFAQWHTHVLEKPLEFEPGTKFVYNTGASIMLNRILENATGMSLSEFTKTYFMNRTNSVLLPNNQNLQAKKLPRDMLKLGMIYLNNGKWKEEQIISENWVQKSLQPQFDVPEVGARYGYQWWIRNLNTSNSSYKCQYASGNGGQFIMIVKELNLVVVFTGGNFGGGGHAFEIMLKHILPAFEDS